MSTFPCNNIVCIRLKCLTTQKFFLWRHTLPWSLILGYVTCYLFTCWLIIQGKAKSSMAAMGTISPIIFSYITLFGQYICKWTAPFMTFFCHSGLNLVKVFDFHWNAFSIFLTIKFFEYVIQKYQYCIFWWESCGQDTPAHICVK